MTAMTAEQSDRLQRLAKSHVRSAIEGYFEACGIDITDDLVKDQIDELTESVHNASLRHHR